MLLLHAKAAGCWCRACLCCRTAAAAGASLAATAPAAWLPSALTRSSGGWW